MLLVAVFSAAQRGEQGLGKEGQGTQFTRFTSTKVMHVVFLSDVAGTGNSCPI
jgi:hypothetical protein